MYQKIMKKMISCFGADVRRINHAVKVYGFASSIAALENLHAPEYEIVKYSAILHDIGIKECERKYNSTAGNYQELEGPPIAASIMNECGIPDVIGKRVCHLIGHHHSYNSIDGIDFQILVEADFLVNIFEDGMKKDAIENIYKNIFKTRTGKDLLETMYTTDTLQ